jgi:hypothetical protein
MISFCQIFQIYGFAIPLHQESPDPSSKNSQKHFIKILVEIVIPDKS